MTVFLEISAPWQWRPWRFRSRLMARFGWGPIAFGWIRVPFPEFCETDKEWRA